MADLAQVQRGLEERLAQLQARVAKMEGDLRRPPDRDWTEHATEAENDEVLERLGEAERREIEQIQVALERLRAGSYDTCARCGEPIGEGRLRSLPYATACIRCAA